MNTLFVMVDYKKSVYVHALIHFSLICDGASDKVIPTSSHILSKLDEEKLILVLRTRFVHIASRIHHNCDIKIPYVWSKCVRKSVLRIRSYAPASLF